MLILETLPRHHRIQRCTAHHASNVRCVLAQAIGDGEAIESGPQLPNNVVRPDQLRYLELDAHDVDCLSGDTVEPLLQRRDTTAAAAQEQANVLRPLERRGRLIRRPRHTGCQVEYLGHRIEIQGSPAANIVRRATKFSPASSSDSEDSPSVHAGWLSAPDKAAMR